MTVSNANNGGTGCSTSPRVITRTYTLKDEISRTADVTSIQTFTVIDTTAPLLGNVPAAATVECNAVPPPASPTATDNCGGTPVVSSDRTRTDGSCPNNYSLTRTWTATDACGNTDTKSLVITVRDATSPVIDSAPADTTVNICSDPLPTAPSLNVIDNCDPPKTVPAVCCVDGAGVKRTWSSMDSCGNAATSRVQTIGFTPTC